MRKELKGLLERRAEGEVVGIASTENPDRDGEVIVQSGWDLTNFLNNPVILAHHNYHNFPIGQATKIAVENGKLMFTVLFTKATEEARQAYQLIQEGVLRTFSVGYIPREYDPKDQNRTLRAELLEISVVAVPANPEAVVYAKSFVKNDLAVRLCKEWLLDDKLRGEVERLERTKAVGKKATKEVAPAEEKGAIQDKLDNPSEYQIKEENCHEIWKALDAFMTIYWDETIPAADFSPLCKELAKVIAKLGTDSVLGKGALKDLTGNDDDDEDDDEDKVAMKEAKFKKFLAAFAEKESTTGDSNVETSGEDGAKVEEKNLDIRLIQQVTGNLQELLRVAKATRKGGAK
jgi:HK97 family phage prohead protease